MDAELQQRLESARPRVLRYLQGMIQDPDRAEDLCQAACAQACERIAQLRDPGRFESWLFSIAINNCRRHLRDTARAPLSEAPADPIRHSVLSSLIRRETALSLALAIDRLPILLREALILHHINGIPYAQMAEICAASVNALQVRCHRAKALLRQQLGEDFEPGPPGPMLPP